MPTSDTQEPEVEEIDATEEEWRDEEDPTASEEIVPYEGGIVPHAQWDLKAVFRGFEGVALWTHDSTAREKKPALYYDVENRGRGLTVRTMRILAAMRGGFDELDLDVSKAPFYEAVIGKDGKPVIEETPAIRATVRIRDLVYGNVRIGTWVEPVAKYSKRSGTYYTVPNPGMLAIAKAKRAAYSDHFAPIIEPLLKAIIDECRQGRAFFSGEVPQWVVTALPEDEAGQERVPSAVDRKRQRAEASLGNAGRDDVLARLLPLEATLGPKVREEFVAWGVETFGTSKVADWPARRKAEVDAWFAEKAEELGQALDGERVAGDEERPDPFEDAEKTQAPTEQEVRALIASTAKSAVAEAYKAAGMKQTEPFDSPDKALRLWNALQQARAGHGKTEEAAG